MSIVIDNVQIAKIIGKTHTSAKLVGLRMTCKTRQKQDKKNNFLPQNQNKDIKLHTNQY